MTGETRGVPPRVSVCIPVRNGAPYIAQAVRSALDQADADLEVVVQDNASTDGTWEILEAMAAADPRLKIARNPVDIGMAPNWNAVIDRARGDHLVFLSGDDFLEPGHVRRCLEAFDRHGADIVTPNHYWLRGDRKAKRRMPVREKVHRDFARMLLLQNPFSINFTAFRREAALALRRNGRLFPLPFHTCDLDLWIRAALSGTRVCYLREPLGTYRVHGGNISRGIRRMHRHAILTLLRHKRALRKACPVVFRLVLAVRTVRTLVNAASAGPLDRRLLRVQLREIIR